ncbi:MAG: glycosyl hydrolase family 18 protein [Marmoricola sp.]
MRKRFGVAVLLATMIALLPASSALPATTRLPVLGFQESWDSTTFIDRSATALGSVGVDGVDLSESGTSVDVPDSSMLTQMRRAHHDHLPAVLLVGNWSSVINDFSERVAHRMLISPRNRRAVAMSLTRSVTRQGWDGINVDLESLNTSDTAGLVAFLRELRGLLPRRATLSIDLMNETSAADMQADGYDLNGIGRAVNRVVLMAYDENGPWNPHTPGPIGALAWQRAGLHVLLKRIPASKVVLGVAGYGYAWRPSGAVSVSDRQARALAASYHVAPQWRSTVGEWTATLPDGSVLWWSDARSFGWRRTMATNFHLAGLAVWDLGLSDPIR